MRFILQMAWRDSRASRRRLLLFSLSIALGVAALVALGSLATILAEAVQIQTKSLLGADLIVTSRAPFDPKSAPISRLWAASRLPRSPSRP
jgi:putative ABC transport system permease protein